MTMIHCIRRMEFDAAHRVMEHESKCKYLHGHRYALEIYFTADHLDSLGRVIDFQEIKQILGEWIDTNWDHNAVLHKDDEELGSFVQNYTNQKVFYLPYNPTAENMARYLMDEVCPTLFGGTNVVCTKLRLYETPNSYVEAVAS